MIQLWRYENFRYAKWLCLLLIICGSIYTLDDPIDSPNGGTFVGYSLGICAAFFSLLLFALGAKRRWWIHRFGSQQAWLSFHLYAGLALVPITLWHSGFQWSSSLHGVLFTLLVAVTLSGLYGVYSYAVHPSQLRQINQGLGSESLLQAVNALDEQLWQDASSLPTQTKIMLRSALTYSWKPLGLWHCLLQHDSSQMLVPIANGFELTPNPRQQTLYSKLQGAEHKAVVDKMSERMALLDKYRSSWLLENQLGNWLQLHLALTMIFLAMLITHIWVVLYY